MEQQGLQGPRIALLIDFDNVVIGVDDPPGFDVELVVNALRSRGVIVLGRAYGDWYRHSRHRRKLMEQGIELVETPAFGPVIKNSADIRIALDAFEIGMTQDHISQFCLVSGDSDFLPLVKRLQLLGKSVIVIAGHKFTSDLIRRNCNEYISYENLLAESVGATEDATTLEGAYALLSRTVNTMNERGQDTRSSSVKQMMLQLNPVFSEQSFGCNQFKQFLNKAARAGIIRIERNEGNSGERRVILLDDESEDSDIEGTSSKNGTCKPILSDLEMSPVSHLHEPAKLSRKVNNGDHKLEDAESSEEDDIAKNASSISAARRSKLRSSGRTWRGGETCVKVLEVTANTATETVTIATHKVDDIPTKVHDDKPDESTFAGAESNTDHSELEAAAKNILVAELSAENDVEKKSEDTATSNAKATPKKRATLKRRTSSRTTKTAEPKTTKTTKKTAKSAEKNAADPAIGDDQSTAKKDEDTLKKQEETATIPVIQEAASTSTITAPEETVKEKPEAKSKKKADSRRTSKAADTKKVTKKTSPKSATETAKADDKIEGKIADNPENSEATPIDQPVKATKTTKTTRATKAAKTSSVKSSDKESEKEADEKKTKKKAAPKRRTSSRATKKEVKEETKEETDKSASAAEDEEAKIKE